MAQLPIANVLPPTIASEQLVVPADYMATEPNQETRKEKYQQHILSHDLVCAICTEVPYNPITGHCGATLCTTCTNSAFSAQPNKCPKCNALGVVKGYFGPNMHARTQIATLQATCILECGAIDTVRGIIEHQVNICPLRIITCKQCKKNIIANTLDEHNNICETTCKFCKQMVRVTMRKEHLEQSCMSQCTLCNEICLSLGLDRHKSLECMMRLTNCNQCNERVPYSKVPVHITTICGMTPVECPRGCGTNYLRYDKSQHEALCPFMMISCDICLYECVRQDMAAHKADSLPHIDHLIKTQRLEIEGLNRLNAMLTERYMQLSQKVEELHHQFANNIMQQNSSVSDTNKFQNEIGELLPLFLGPTITHEHYTLHLFELSNAHRCDFCPLVHGRKQNIGKTLGKYYAYRAPGTDDIDMCLKCAVQKCVKTKEVLAMMSTCVKPVHFASHSGSEYNVHHMASHPTQSVNPHQMSVSWASAATSPMVAYSLVGKPPRHMVPGYIYKITPFNAKMTVNKTNIVVQSHHIDIEGQEVRRGPNWHHDNQDGDGIGVIVRRDLDCVFVSWHNGLQDGCYYIDTDGEHHLVYA